MMRANGQYNDYLDGQLREPFKQFCCFHPQGQKKRVFFASNGVKNGPKRANCRLKRANSTVFGPKYT